MSTRKQTAIAFAQRHSAKCHNARTDGQVYILHASRIAEWIAPNIVRLNWCGWRTPTTAAHLNDILAALGIPERVSRVACDEVRDYVVGGNT